MTIVCVSGEHGIASVGTLKNSIVVVSRSRIVFIVLMAVTAANRVESQSLVVHVTIVYVSVFLTLVTKLSIVLKVVPTESISLSQLIYCVGRNIQQANFGAYFSLIQALHPLCDRPLRY
jgi:hypothetical protein